MRIPFLAGWYDRSRNRTRVLVARGRTPRVFPGPWRLEAVVREEDAGDAPSNSHEPGCPQASPSDPGDPHRSRPRA